MTDIVIVAYRPKPGMEDSLRELVTKHVPMLREIGLATEAPATTMQGNGGVVVEVFEWAEGGIQKAHGHPQVQALWEQFSAVCDYVPLKELPEAGQMFAEFKPL